MSILFSTCDCGHTTIVSKIEHVSEYALFQLYYRLAYNYYYRDVIEDYSCTKCRTSLKTEIFYIKNCYSHDEYREYKKEQKEIAKYNQKHQWKKDNRVHLPKWKRT